MGWVMLQAVAGGVVGGLIGTYIALTLHARLLRRRYKRALLDEQRKEI